MFIAFLKFLMRWFQRLVVLAALIALGVWLFYIGREHQVFLDNKTLGEFKALEQVNVSVNGGEVSELMARERGVKKVVGPKFEIKAEVFDEDGEIVNTITKEIQIDKIEWPEDFNFNFNFRFSKDIMINLPTLVAGEENFIVPAPR
ncbi:MAG: hypothetical protein IJS40_00135 [Synergistaceae bacterium]|nr:hypothetical protein [Synergistaceae bacterium]